MKFIPDIFPRRSAQEKRKIKDKMLLDQQELRQRRHNALEQSVTPRKIKTDVRGIL